MQIETMLPGTEPNVAMAASASGATGIELIARAARMIEEWGFDGATTPETGHDPFLPLAIAAEHTQRIALGTNVAIAFPRSPMTVAQAAWDIQSWSGGRFRLGIGTQVKGHNERRYSAPWTGPPGPRLREYVLCLKAIFQTFRENRLTPFEGEHYRFNLISPAFSPGAIKHPQVPIYVSALNPYMARLAGELCDGVRLHPLSTASYVRDVMLPQIEKGAGTAGRRLADVDIVGMPFVLTGPDEQAVEAAKAAVRLHIAFYASTRTYHAVLRHHGWGDTGMELHRLSTEGRWQEMGALISDEILQEFAVLAPYDTLAARLRERWGDICSTIFVPMPPAAWDGDAGLAEALRGLHDG